jgi:hypothetical protein
VYLSIVNPGAYQRLILSETTTLSSTASASAQFLPAGSLVVNNVITGAGAQLQDAVTIQVVCTQSGQQADFVIPAGTVARSRSQTYTGLQQGESYTVTENGDRKQ